MCARKHSRLDTLLKLKSIWSCKHTAKQCQNKHKQSQLRSKCHGQFQSVLAMGKYEVEWPDPKWCKLFFSAVCKEYDLFYVDFTTWELKEKAIDFLYSPSGIKKYTACLWQRFLRTYWADNLQTWPVILKCALVVRFVQSWRHNFLWRHTRKNSWSCA